MHAQSLTSLSITGLEYSGHTKPFGKPKTRKKKRKERKEKKKAKEIYAVCETGPSRGNDIFSPLRAHFTTQNTNKADMRHWNPATYFSHCYFA